MTSSVRVNQRYGVPMGVSRSSLRIRCDGRESYALEAGRRLVADGRMQPDDTVMLFNTGGALKCLDVIRK